MTRTTPVSLIVLIFCAASAAPAFASEQMKYEDCLQTIRSVSAKLGVAPIDIEATDDLRSVRYPMADGSVFITCSRLDQTMVITESDE